MGPSSIDPSEDPPADLADLARAGRMQREAAAAGRLRAQRRNQTVAAALHRREERLMTYTTWKSLSAAMSLVSLAMFLTFIGALLTGLEVLRASALLLVVGSSLALLVIAVATTLVARRRDLAYRAALPYTTTGYASVLGHASRSAECTVEFVAARPTSQSFTDLLIKLPHPTTVIAVSSREFTVKVEPTALNILDDHARWFPRWFHSFNESVLRPLHATHPIRTLTLR